MSSRDLQFHIEGMDCSEEISILRRELTPLVGEEDRLAFDVLGKRMTVRLPEGSTVSSAILVAAVGATGMKATPISAGATRPATPETDGRALTTIGSGVAAALGLGIHAVLAGDFMSALGSEGMGVADAVPLPARAAYLVSVVLGAWPVLPKAWLAAAGSDPT